MLISHGGVYAIKGGFFQLVVLSGKTPGRVLNLKKKPGEGFIQGRVFPTATPVLCIYLLEWF